MALRFIIGRSGTGKTRLCMDEIIKKQQESMHTKQILIVPEQFTSQTERDLLSLSPNKTILFAEVLSFGRLAHQFFSKYGQGKGTPLGDIGKIMAIQKVLLDEKNNISYFQHVLDKHGFAEQISLTLTEFFQYEITPEQLESYMSKEQLPHGVQEKIHDLSCIYKAYTKFLDQDYITDDETLHLLSGGLARKFDYADTEFYLDGFYGFTPQEVSVIAQLLMGSKNVTITLPMDEKSYFATNLHPTAPFFESMQTKASLLSLAEELSVATASPILLQENLRSKTEGLQNLEQYYFQGYYKKCPLQDGVSIISCTTKQEEIAMVAQKIQYLVKANNLRYRDFAIVTNNIDLYEKNIRSDLSHYEIPHFIDKRLDISNHPFITMVQGLLDMLVFDFTYESVFSYLKTQLSPLSMEEVDLLENYVLAYGIKGYKWHMEEWKYGLQREGEDALLLINSLKKRFLEPLAPLISMQKKSFLLSDFLQALYHHFAEIGTSEHLEDWMNLASQSAHPEKAEEHKQIWSIFLEVLEKAQGILGNEKMKMKEASGILKAGFGKCTMGVIPATLDCVLVGDIERSRLPEIKYLFVVGVNEGILPAPAQAQGIFTEQERELLSQKGLSLASSAKQKAYEEQFLIYYGLTKPSHGLYLLFANGDTQGKALLPSSLIHKLMGMDSELQMEVAPEFQLETTLPQQAFRYLVQKIGTHTQELPLDSFWMDLYGYFANSPKWNPQIDILQKGFVTNIKQERLSPKIAKKLYGKTIFSSVSRLERFASCPFSYFMEYGVRAKERSLYQLGAPDLGLLFHSVLENFSLQLQQDQVSWSELDYNATQTRVHDAVATVAPTLSNEILLASSSNQYLIKRLERIATSSAWTLVRHMQSGDFKPIGYEVGFGNQEDLPPIQLQLPDGGQLILSGKIDRVDILDTNGKRYVKIIDYKSGSKSFQFQDVYYGLQLQLLMYLDAYVQHHKETETPLQPAGVFYFRITDPRVSISESTSTEEIGEMLYKKMQMSGLVLENDAVIQGLDHVFLEDYAGNASQIVPVGFTKKGAPSSTSYLANADDFTSLLEFVGKKATEIGTDIKSGYMAPSPYRNGTKTPCTYCRFRSICKHQTGDQIPYRNLEKISKAGFWDKIHCEDN
ncbi:helicase-exonuclease AddAB subunit AddB [Chakrabartyella piscis]|uniref:helicase-exonuclease AddAB subunit AddB n=1 Tax=Chakrabartyella piscis TaxID=2918914 RepID=UPI002958B693|nr:helicase-exonuclease AddAB subunit AddB [Chakrabartyella piscis]